jgi:hypothetical protein
MRASFVEAIHQLMCIELFLVVAIVKSTMIHGGLSCISGLSSTSNGRSVTLASSRGGISSGGAVKNDSWDGTHPCTSSSQFYWALAYLATILGSVAETSTAGTVRMLGDLEIPPSPTSQYLLRSVLSEPIYFKRECCRSKRYKSAVLRMLV